MKDAFNINNDLNNMSNQYSSKNILSKVASYPKSIKLNIPQTPNCETSVLLDELSFD
jgi:hypothetical protein